VRLANELLVEVITVHIGDTLDFFWYSSSSNFLPRDFTLNLG